MDSALRKFLVTLIIILSVLSCDYLVPVLCMVPSEAISPSSSPPPWSVQYPAETPGEVWYEDDGWWDGAEEVDLTLPYDVHPEGEDEEGDLIDNILFFNESFYLDVECEDFSQMPSPPSFMGDLPPPPLPPFLMGIDEILRESTRRWNRRKGGDVPSTDYEYESDDLFSQKLKWVTFEDDRCSVCDWANGGNETISMLAKKPDSDVILSHTMVGILIGVALVSAAIGATVMGVMLKCKRIKVMPCARGRNWLRSSFGRRDHSSNSVGRPTPARDKPHISEGTSNTRAGLAMKLWRRGSSQATLNPCSSPGSENSYSEEPYINADASSATYAELSIAADSIVRLEPSPSMPMSQNTYSEIPSPVRTSDLNLCSKLCGHEGTYENAGYMLSEAHTDHTESSTGSNSTPSSAYYSDVSSCDIYTNKKKKKKRKGEERFSLQTSYPIIGGNLSTSVGIPVICSHVAHKPVHLNLNAVQPQYVSNRDNVPVTLQLLPRQISFDQRGLDTVSTNLHHQGIFQNSNLNQNIGRHNPRLHLSLRNQYDPNQISVISAQNLATCGTHRDGHLPTHLEGHIQPNRERQIHPLIEGHIDGHFQLHLDSCVHSHMERHNQPHVESHFNSQIDTNVQPCMDGHIQSNVENQVAPSNNSLLPQHLEEHLSGHPAGHPLPSGVFEGQLDNHEQEAMLRQYNGNVVQRPLPPLPSRQMNDLRRKNFKVMLDNGIQDIPSDV